MGHDTQFLRKFTTRTNTLLASSTHRAWPMVCSASPSPLRAAGSPHWELRDIFLTAKQESSSSGWNSRTSCWSCSLPWGLLLDMSLQHFSILFQLPAAAVWVSRHTDQGWSLLAGAAPRPWPQPGLLSAVTTQIRIWCLAAAEINGLEGNWGTFQGFWRNLRPATSHSGSQLFHL